MDGRIVVGVDGSDHARAALAFAIAEARRRDGALVEAIMTHPPIATYPSIEYGAPSLDQATVDAAAMQELEAVLATVPTDVHVEPRVTEGSPAAALVAASRGADLVVVGTRGRGGFRSLLLGSTSQQVATHAECPVVIVPLRTETDRDDEAEDDR